MPRLKVKQTQSARATVSLCRLCHKPPCIPACARGAISQSVVTRLTVVDSSKCAECETLACVAACPFGAIHAHRERRILLVCDRCLHLDSPACVRACPTGVFKLS